MKTIQDELARIYADRELNRVDALRGCVKARQQGLTQTEIAQKLSLSQPEVHRILRRAANYPELLERRPREVVLDFHAERISHEQMMDELSAWSYTFCHSAEPDNPEGAVSEGSWEDIVDAVHRDLLDVDDYRTIAAAVGMAKA